MIIQELDSTKSISISLASASASACDVTAVWADSAGSGSSMTFTESGSAVNTSGSSLITAIPAPASGTTRTVREITIYNPNTLAVLFSLKLNTGYGTYVFWSDYCSGGKTYALSNASNTGTSTALPAGHVIRDVLNSVTMTQRGQLNISGTTLVDEPGTGSAGDTLLNLYNQVVQIASASQTPRQNINFVSGATAADNPGNNSTDITIAAGSQTYILDSQVRSWMGL